jgi:hypothetical protein
MAAKAGYSDHLPPNLVQFSKYLSDKYLQTFFMTKIFRRRLITTSGLYNQDQNIFQCFSRLLIFTYKLSERQGREEPAINRVWRKTVIRINNPIHYQYSNVYYFFTKP